METNDALIAYLCNRKFSDYSKLKNLASLQAMKVPTPLAKLTFSSEEDSAALDRRAAACREYEVSLRKMSYSGLKELADEERKKEAQEWAAKVEERERSASFNQPSAMADATVYDRWAQRRYWNLDEALLLILGRNPEKVRLESLSSSVQISAFAQKHAETRAIMLTHVGGRDGQLTETVHPGVFLRWAERYKKPVPPALLAAVKEYGHNVHDWQDAYANLEKKHKLLEAGIDAATAKFRDMAEQAMAQAKASHALAEERGNRVRLLEAALSEVETRAATKQAQEPVAPQQESVEPPPSKRRPWWQEYDPIGKFRRIAESRVAEGIFTERGLHQGTVSESDVAKLVASLIADEAKKDGTRSRGDKNSVSEKTVKTFVREHGYRVNELHGLPKPKK